MHELLVNRLGGLSLPRESVVRLTDRPDMTLDVYRGRKTTTQQQQLYSKGKYLFRKRLAIKLPVFSKFLPLPIFSLVIFCIERTDLKSQVQGDYLQTLALYFRARLFNASLA